MHVFCKNIGRAQWPTSWEHLLSKLDLCFSSSTGLYWCSGLWQVFLTCLGHFLRVGNGSKDNQSLGYSDKLFIYLFMNEAVQSELLSGHICLFKLYSISSQLCHKPGYFWPNTESRVSLWYKLSHNWNLWFCHFSRQLLLCDTEQGEFFLPLLYFLSPTLLPPNPPAPSVEYTGVRHASPGGLECGEVLCESYHQKTLSYEVF